MIVTYVDVRGAWHATTVATQSATQPDEWGYYAAHRLTGGECIGAMLDTHAPSGPSRYLVKLRNGVRDGARCRPGGAKRANDPRGTGLPANALPGEQVWAMGLRAGVRMRVKAEVVKLRNQFPRIVVKYVATEEDESSRHVLPDVLTAYLHMGDIEERDW